MFLYNAQQYNGLLFCEILVLFPSLTLIWTFSFIHLCLVQFRFHLHHYFSEWGLVPQGSLHRSVLRVTGIRILHVLQAFLLPVPPLTHAGEGKPPVLAALLQSASCGFHCVSTGSLEVSAELLIFSWLPLLPHTQDCNQLLEFGEVGMPFHLVWL